MARSARTQQASKRRREVRRFWHALAVGVMSPDEVAERLSR